MCVWCCESWGSKTKLCVTIMCHFKSPHHGNLTLDLLLGCCICSPAVTSTSPKWLGAKFNSVFFILNHILFVILYPWVYNHNFHLACSFKQEQAVSGQKGWTKSGAHHVFFNHLEDTFRHANWCPCHSERFWHEDTYHSERWRNREGENTHSQIRNSQVFIQKLWEKPWSTHSFALLCDKNRRFWCSVKLGVMQRAWRQWLTHR